MDRRMWLGALAVVSLLMTGCAASPSDFPPSPGPQASHSMPGGTEMSGSEHEPEQENTEGPSDAAQMICTGQVVGNVTDVLGLERELSPSSAWDKPMFTCTYDVDGDPLVLSVHDATDVSEGVEHFAALQGRYGNAEDIEGMAGLGMPSFSTGDGIVAFVRDGKTLLVDATALPNGLGPDGTRTQSEAAYTLASAVLVCWVEHD